MLDSLRTEHVGLWHYPYQNSGMVRLTCPARWASLFVHRLFSEVNAPAITLHASWLRHSDGLEEALVLPSNAEASVDETSTLRIEVRAARGDEVPAADGLLPNTGVLWLWRDGSWTGFIRPAGSPDFSFPVADIDELWLPGPGMHLLPNKQPRCAVSGASAQSWRGGSAAGWLVAASDGRDPDGRFSRQAGSLGWSAVEAMRQRRFALVGCGRNGHALALLLAAYSPREIVLIDPDHVEPGNADSGLAYCAPPLPVHAIAPAMKVHRLQHLLSGRLPLSSVVALPQSIALPSAATRASTCDVIVSATDSDAARLVCASIAQACHRVHLDVGSLVNRNAGGKVELGADIRLTIPGDRDLCCLGGFASRGDVGRYAVGEPDREAGPWSIRKAGALTSWSTVVAGVGMRLLEDLAAERVHQSHWVRIRQSEADRAPIAQDLGAPRDSHCPLCGLAGQGYKWMGRMRDLAAAAVIRADQYPVDDHDRDAKAW